MHRILVAAAAAAALAAAGPATAASDSPVVVLSAKPHTFSPQTVVVERGGTLRYVNADPVGGTHTITHDVRRKALFTTAPVDTGAAVDVAGVEKLPAGQYPFVCLVHPFMSGTLVVN